MTDNDTEPREWTVHRSAITGRFVTREYAEANPETTIAHTMRERGRC